MDQAKLALYPRGYSVKDRTEYRVVQARDYRVAEAFLGEPTVYPTVLAWRGGQVIGGIGTLPFNPKQPMVICGPLKVALPRPIHVARRLVAHYEAELKRRGIVAYHYHVAFDNAAMRACADHEGAVPYQTSDIGWWYRREIA